MITKKRLRYLLSYDRDTGVFTRKADVPGITVGAVAGTKFTNGYIYAQVDGQRYNAASLAWLYVTGQWCEVDHKDNNPSNNRWKNLRKSKGRGHQNANRRLFRNNTSGFKGVSKKDGRWRAKFAGVELGLFDSPEAASKAYAKAARAKYGKFSQP